MTVAALDLDSSVDPWSPGYVTPASTPSPRSSRSRSPGGGGGGGSPADHALRALRAAACLPQAAQGAQGALPRAKGATGKQQARVAVSVRDAHHSYANYSLNRLTGMNAVTHVLSGFDMTVRQGSIYALLGASGCGKTTVLRALVGQHRLTAGRVRVFGREPRARAGVPGPSLGYMPQELAVPDGFTIRETLHYFGWLAGMDTPSIQEHSAALVRLLDLPGQDRLVCDLSGGQQRRVSLAVALLHRPPLLILDEPTVGVDPIVRQNIWDHLLEQTSSGRTTVIITTHYIEEARQAHVAGLMRRGAVLAEDSPDALLAALSCSSLEDVLLKLCLRQDADEADLQKVIRADPRRAGAGADLELGEFKGVTADRRPRASAASDDDDLDGDISARVELRVAKTSSKAKALLWKNCMWAWRHRLISTVFLLLPAFITLVYNGGVGANPRGLPVAVVNQESNCSDWQGAGRIDCDAPADLSCIFLDQMASQSLRTVAFPEAGLAERAVLEGRAWGVVYFASNFTQSLVERVRLTVSVEYPREFPDQEDSAIEHSIVNVKLDMSLQTIGYLLQQSLHSVVTKSLEDFNQQCQKNVHMIRAPLQFHSELRPTPRDPSFLDYSLPGLILSVVFMFGFTTTMSALLPEKTDKILERSLVYGVNMGEVLLAQFAAQLLLIVGQIALVLVVAFGLFSNLFAGSALAYGLLCLAQGVCGMWYGLLTAVIFDSTTAASLVGVGSYFTLMFCSSMLWPLEGMHMLLRPIATILPMTTATISLRSIALRAWNLHHPSVYLGFLSTFSWIIAFVILTFFTIKLRF